MRANITRQFISLSCMDGYLHPVKCEDIRTELSEMEELANIGEMVVGKAVNSIFKEINKEEDIMEFSEAINVASTSVLSDDLLNMMDEDMAIMVCHTLERMEKLAMLGMATKKVFGEKFPELTFEPIERVCIRSAEELLAWVLKNGCSNEED